MTAEELCAKWSSRRNEYRHLGVLVDGARLCEDVLVDLRLLFEADSESALNLSEAAEISGYSREHIGRLVKQGKIENVGRPHAPRVRRGDLPMKPGSLPSEGNTKHIVYASRRQTVRSVVDSGRGTR
jgi:hypothetical protein